VTDSPYELRRQADHCRDLARTQFDEQARRILGAMADEFERQADGAEAADKEPT
jgi:hypothetical protein